MFDCNLYLLTLIKLRGGRNMEFWIIMIAFIALGGTCSLAGTWWLSLIHILESDYSRHCVRCFDESALCFSLILSVRLQPCAVCYAAAEVCYDSDRHRRIGGTGRCGYDNGCGYYHNRSVRKYYRGGRLQAFSHPGACGERNRYRFLSLIHIFC